MVDYIGISMLLYIRHGLLFCDYAGMYCYCIFDMACFSVITLVCIVTVYSTWPAFLWLRWYVLLLYIRHGLLFCDYAGMYCYCIFDMACFSVITLVCIVTVYSTWPAFLWLRWYVLLLYIRHGLLFCDYAGMYCYCIFDMACFSVITLVYIVTVYSTWPAFLWLRWYVLLNTLRTRATRFVSGMTLFY